MRVVQVKEDSPMRDLFVGEAAAPLCGDSQVLIAVHAAGVNRADLMQRAGKYPPPPGASPILGLEVSGTIIKVGPAVSGHSTGERVCALLAGGGYAETVAVPAAHVMRLPQNLSFEEGAGLPEAFITAFVNLFQEGELKANEKVLIHGGSSGVGTAGIQLAKVAGAHVACTVGNKIKAAACTKLGAEVAIDYKQEDFVEAARNWSPGGVDLILDCVGVEYLQRNVSLLANKGRLVMIASMGGATGVLDIPQIMKRRARVVGSVLRSRSDAEKGSIIAAFAERFLPLFASGELKVVVDTTIALEKADDAHARMRLSEHIGKIVLKVR
jgi:NADPH2:quinone reductase